MAGPTVVAKVGASSITAARLAARFDSMPDAQRNALGKTRQDVFRHLLERALIPEALYGEAARVRHLDADPTVREQMDQVLRNACIDELLSHTSVSDEELQSYYESHGGDFDAPARVGLWRILAATRDEAQKVLDEAKRGINAWRWKDLSREHSTDNATKWRGGELGFVASDGSSSEPAVRANPAIVAAAEKVKDGELVPEPILEGEGYAVIWRRESMPAVHKSLAQVADAIREIVLRQKLEQAVRERIQALAQEVRPESHPELLSLIEVDNAGRTTPLLRSSATPIAPAAPRPSSTPRGLR